jgi:hypothetical protein
MENKTKNYNQSSFDTCDARKLGILRKKGKILLALNLLNKRAMMALDRSPELSNSSKQLPRQAF